MTIGLPQFAVAIGVPNPTFSVGSVTDPKQPEGWTVAGGNPTATGLFRDTSGAKGHARAQRYTATTVTIGLRSAVTPAYKLTNPVSTKFLAVCWNRRTNWTGGQTFKVQIQWRNAADSAVGVTTDLISVAGAQASWTVDVGTATLTPPSGAHHAVAFVDCAVSSGKILDLRYCEIGAWNTTTDAYYTMTRTPWVPYECTQDPSDDGQADAMGKMRWTDLARRTNPHRLRMSLALLPSATDALALRTLWQLNHGVGGGGNTSQPSGGRWPILWVPNHSDMPGALTCDWPGQFSLFPDGPIHSDPPTYGGSVELVERVL